MFLQPQTGSGPGCEGYGVQPLWEKCPKNPQDESRRFYTDGAPAGLLQVLQHADKSHGKSPMTQFNHNWDVSVQLPNDR